MTESVSKPESPHAAIFTSKEKLLLVRFCEPLGIGFDIDMVRDADLIEICEYISRQFARSGLKLNGDLGNIMLKAETAKKHMLDEIETLASENPPVCADENLPAYLNRYIDSMKRYPADVRIRMAGIRCKSLLEDGSRLKEFDPDSITDMATLDILEKLTGTASYFSQKATAGRFGTEESGDAPDIGEARKSYYIAQLEARNAIIAKGEANDPDNLARAFTIRLKDAGEA
jgi:hypothetical protein